MQKFKNIPQQAFMYWGNSPMPYACALSVLSFKKHNPDIPVTWIKGKKPTTVHSPTWGTHEQKNKYTGIDFSHLAMHYIDNIIKIDLPDVHDVQRADMCRQWCMYEHGGLWFDMDILFIRNLSMIPIPEESGIVVSWATNKKKRFFSTGLVMTQAKTEYYKTVYEAAWAGADVTKYQSLGPDLVRRLFPEVGDIEAVSDGITVSNMPMESFYAVLYNELNKLFEEHHPERLDNAIGVHWYGGADLSMQMKNRLAPTALSMYNNTTFGEALRRAI